MASASEIEQFLKEVSHRAYRQAMFAVKNEESALDLVQESMLKLSDKYGDKPAAELPLLFTRILQTTILDYHRRQKVRNTWTTLFSSFQKDDEDEFDVLESLMAADGSCNLSAQDEVELSQNMDAIQKAVELLPDRQRQAFLLRYWEEMDLAETAAIMGCSEGSVKTHCSRATKTLAEILRKQGFSL